METADEDVKRMLGNPRHAIRSMSVPLIIAVFIAYLQNFVDTVWCSGLGASAISAISVSGPLFWIITDIGIGLGVGASTSISRAIGANDRERSDSLASQTLVLAAIVSFLMMIVLILISDPVLEFTTDGGDTSMCREYLTPYFVCMVPIVLHGTIIGMLRSEGASRKVLQLSIISTAINLVIDPLLIYGLDLGLTGAAMATCIAFIIPMCMGLYWYLGGKMHVRPTFRRFRIRIDEMRDVMSVGIPSTLQLSALCILMIPQNMFVLRAGGDVGLMLAMTPYKYILLAIIPAQGLSEAMIPVTSALQGAGRISDARAGFLYTVRLSTVICIILSLFLILAANPLMYAFSYSEEMSQYHSDLVRVMRIYGFIVLFAGLSDVCSGIMQSLRMAMLSTLAITAREVIFILAYWYASAISMDAIYISMVTCMFLGLVIMGGLALYCIKRMDSHSEKVPPISN